MRDSIRHRGRPFARIGASLMAFALAGVVKRALLYWMTVGTGDAFVDFDGHPVTGSLVGASRSPCAGAANGGATRVYRANVTSLVPGAGTYDVSRVGELPGIAEGASLVLLLTSSGSPVKGQVIIKDGARTAKQQQQIQALFRRCRFRRPKSGLAP